MKRIVVLMIVALLLSVGSVSTIAAETETQKSSCYYAWVQSASVQQGISEGSQLLIVSSSLSTTSLSPMDLGAYKYDVTNDSLLYQIFAAIVIVLACALAVVLTLIILSLLQQPRHSNQLYPNSSFLKFAHHPHARHFLSHPKHCVHCGAKNKTNASVCKKCGKNFSE